MRKPNKLPSALVAVLVTGAALMSCSNGDAKGTAAGPSRSETIAGITADVILPGLAQSADTASELENVITDLCVTPTDEHLELAKGSWHKAHDAWMATSAYRVGPIGKLRSKAKIGYPVNTEKLEFRLSSGTIELDKIDELGADLRGLGGIEYVLFNPANAAGLTPERCAYAEAAAASVAKATLELNTAWTDEYSKEFEASGQDAIDDLVNAALAALATVEDMEFGPDSTAELDSVRAVWGKAPDGLAGLVASRSATTAESFTKALDSADSALERVNDLRVKLRTEVASQLGVTVTFTDSDGDG